MRILSIQSHVTYGHVGNAAATFALQRLGHEVWPVHTVNYATHTGHGRPTGTVTPPAAIRDIVDRLDGLGLLARCDAVLSGYIGDAGTGAAIREAANRVRARNPAAVWCCDPVMGDTGRGLFVSDAVAEFFGRHAAEADILTPNLFELERLSGRTLDDAGAIVAACRALAGRGVREIVVTSLPGTGAGRIAAAAVTAAGGWIAETPEIALAGRPNGAGDLFAAIYLGTSRRPGGSPAAALAHAAAAVHGVLAATRDELDIVGAQDEIVAPGLPVSAGPFGR